MFDLEKQITEWRRQMQANGLQDRAVLDELESHLREEIERQKNSGKDAQAAFEAARQKMGDAQQLKGEFMKNQEAGKVFEWIRSVSEWKKTQFLAFGLVGLFIGWSFLGFFLFRLGSPAEMTLAQQISGLASVATMILLALGGYLGYRYFPFTTSNRGRSVIETSAVILLFLWWTLFMRLILPHFSSSYAQICVAVLWGFTTPAGAFFGVFAGIQSAARKKPLLADS